MIAPASRTVNSFRVMPRRLTLLPLVTCSHGSSCASTAASDSRPTSRQVPGGLRGRNPRALAPPEHTRGVTDCPVTPREDLVELRGLEPLTPRLPALCSPN